MQESETIQKHIAIGSDHIGYPLKETVRKYILELGHDCADMGTLDENRTDYPIYARMVAKAVASGTADLGILICGTGVGMGIAANKVRGIRAATCSESYSATLARQHNNANILTFGARVVGPGLACMIVKAFLEAEFEGGRHADRLELIRKMETDHDERFEQS